MLPGTVEMVGLVLGMVATAASLLRHGDGLHGPVWACLDLLWD
jgi:hypothetical protein